MFNNHLQVMFYFYQNCDFSIMKDPSYAGTMA